MSRALSLSTRYGNIKVPDLENDLIIKSLRTYGEWAQIEIDVLELFIRPGDVVIDVGAYVGTHARAFSEIVGPNGVVHAFEPQPHVFSSLKDNANTTRHCNIIPHQFALASVNGHGHLEYDSSERNWGATRVTHEPESVTAHTVNIQRLDDFNLPHIDFIKADVEGLELEVLKGAAEIAANFKPVFALEVNSLDASSRIPVWAKNHGYRVYGILHKSFNPKNFSNSSDNIFGDAKEATLLLVHSQKIEDHKSAIEQARLTPIKSVDDIALLLLHKPQYHSEILHSTTAATVLGYSYENPVISQEARQTVEQYIEDIQSYEHALSERDQTIQSYEHALSERDQTIQSYEHALSERDQELTAYQTSTSWRVTSPLRALKLFIRSIHHRSSGLFSSPSMRYFPFNQHFVGARSYPSFVRIDDPHQTTAHVCIERADLLGTRVLLTGWAFYPDAPIKEGALHLKLNGNWTTYGAQVGKHRLDVAHDHNCASAEYSGFEVLGHLGNTKLEESLLEFFTPNHPPVKAQIKFRQRTLSMYDFFNIVLRRLDAATFYKAVKLMATGNFPMLINRLNEIRFSVDEFEGMETRLSSCAKILCRESSTSQTSSSHAPVDIIIPVYNAVAYIKPLFESLFANTDPIHRLIVIDDCSPDPSVWPLLKNLLSNWPNTTLLRNDENLGFAGTVNRAASLSDRHFIILNTDTEVPDGWIARLMAPIYLNNDVATTTPMSNAATVCSFPEPNFDNIIFAKLRAHQIDRWFRRVRADSPLIELPSGVGFCMGVNLRAWQEIGAFDDVAFRHGYGEENDWCLRAKGFGYRNVAVPNLFIYHKHGASFEVTTRDSRRKKSLQTVQRRYPHYEDEVRSFIQRDPLKVHRETLKVIIATNEASASPLLVIDHNFGGGANNYRRALVNDAVSEGRAVLLLLAGKQVDGSPTLRLHYFFHDYQGQMLVDDIDVLEEILLKWTNVEELFVNNIVFYNEPSRILRLITTVIRNCNGVSTIAVHDFHLLCPSYTLLNHRGLFCGIPDRSECRACLPVNQFSFNPEALSIDQWRAAWYDVLAAANYVICFSEDSRIHIEKVYPDLQDRIVVQPHTLTVKFDRIPAVNFRGPLNIGVIGSVNYQKGADVVTTVARQLEMRDPDAKVTVIGQLAGCGSRRNIRVTGAFTLSQLPDIIEDEGVNICLFPSISPETFSYVCAEIMELNMPLVCFNLGAPAERVQYYPWGKVVDEISSEAVIRAIYELYTKVQDASGDAQRCVGEESGIGE